MYVEYEVMSKGAVEKVSLDARTIAEAEKKAKKMVGADARLQRVYPPVKRMKKDERNDETGDKDGRKND